MKKIENKTTDIELTADKKARYSDLINLTLDAIPQGGFDVSTMKNRLDVRIALDKANGTIEVSQVQYDTLKGCVNDYRWGKIDQEIIDFVEAVNK